MALTRVKRLLCACLGMFGFVHVQTLQYKQCLGCYRVVPSIRTVGNFFGLSCPRRDKNELLVSAFRLVNLDITQALTITQTHRHNCTLYFPCHFELSSAEQRHCARVSFMILQVLLCVNKRLLQRNPVQGHGFFFWWSLLYHSFTPLRKHCQQFSFKSQASKQIYTLFIFPSFLCKVNPIAIKRKTINCIRSSHFCITKWITL